MKKEAYRRKKRASYEARMAAIREREDALAAAKAVDDGREGALRREKQLYFVEDRVSQAVKVGVASSLRARLTGLQTGNPNELRTAYAVRADERTEGILHAHLLPIQKRGEWFFDGPWLGDLIDDIIDLEIQAGLRAHARGETIESGYADFILTVNDARHIVAQADTPSAFSVMDYVRMAVDMEA